MSPRMAALEETILAGPEVWDTTLRWAPSARDVCQNSLPVLTLLPRGTIPSSWEGSFPNGGGTHTSHHI